MVVLPLPVGPVTSTSPWGRCTCARKRSSISPGMPSWSSFRMAEPWSRSRITTDSPVCVGMVARRTSICLSSTRKVKRPSWGKRFSEISASAISLSRETTAEAIRVSSIICSCNTPSIRRRIRSTSSSGSMWISDAFARTASSKTVWIRRTTGASLWSVLLESVRRSKALSAMSWPTSLARCRN